MNLLFDQNLSHRLCPALADCFLGAVHVREIGLRDAPDLIIWDYAGQHGFAIVTKDADFRQRSQIPISLADCAGALQRVLRKYRDHEVDLADAFLIHLASELGTGEILTLDRDFAFYRWGANRPFQPLVSIW